MSSSSSSNANSDNESESEERNQIREDLSSMSFEEIMKLKDELGAKVYKEAILGIDNRKPTKKTKPKQEKRLNKNRPREESSKRQVPFLGAELRNTKRANTAVETINRDPRFEERAGKFDMKKFKEDYKFLSKVRQKEVVQLNKQMRETPDDEERQQMKQQIQRLLNKNVEDRKWHKQQATLKQEQLAVQKAREEGRKPHFVTKKERRVKELVAQFEQLKKTGKLSKHLEKRRKKNAAKDRKVISFD